jgi:hypothetical protein
MKQLNEVIESDKIVFFQKNTSMVVYLKSDYLFKYLINLIQWLFFEVMNWNMWKVCLN